MPGQEKSRQRRILLTGAAIIGVLLVVLTRRDFAPWISGPAALDLAAAGDPADAAPRGVTSCSRAAPCASAAGLCAAAFPGLRALVGQSDADLTAAVASKTMIGNRLATNFAAVAYVLAVGIPGDLVEAGVAQGGSAASLFLAAAARGEPRGLHLFDTFAGMPAPDVAVDSARAADWTGRIRHPQLEVEAFMTSVGVPRNMTRYHVGDILLTPRGELPCQIAVFRVDTDWKASYDWALEHVYPRVAPGGIVLLDDY